MSARILLASASPEVQAALRAVVERTGDVLLGTVDARSSLLVTATAGDVDVVVLDETFASPALGAARELVAEVPEVGLVLLAREPSRAVLSAALHAGVRAVAALPVVPDDLRRAVAEAAAWSRIVRPRLVPALPETTGGTGLGMLLALAGAKGGVGTTTIAVHLALAAAGAPGGRRVCLADLDVHAGDVRSLLGLPHRRGMTELLDAGAGPAPLVIEDQLTLHGSGLRVLLAPHEGERAADVTAGVVRRVLGHLRTRFDLVVVDTGVAVTPGAVTAVRMADQAVIVATPDTLALRAVQRLLARWSREQVRHDGIGLVLNRTSRDDDIPVELAVRAVAAPLLQTSLPADFAALRSATNTGSAERLPDGPLRVAMGRLAGELGLLPRKRRSRSPARRSSRAVATASLAQLDQGTVRLPPRAALPP